MQWYYSKNGSQLGPVGQGELISKISAGEVSPSDMCWREGMGDWLPISKVGELTVTSATGPSSIPVAPPPDHIADSPYAPPVSTPNPAIPYAPSPASGKATASMVLGIVGIVFGLCGCYGAVISIPCGILAIIFGGQVKNEVVTNPALTGELGKAKAGVIMGWIGIGIGAALTVILILIRVAAGAVSFLGR